MCSHVCTYVYIRYIYIRSSDTLLVYRHILMYRVNPYLYLQTNDVYIRTYIYAYTYVFTCMYICIYSIYISGRVVPF